MQLFDAKFCHSGDKISTLKLAVVMIESWVTQYFSFATDTVESFRSRVLSETVTDSVGSRGKVLAATEMQENILIMCPRCCTPPNPSQRVISRHCCADTREKFLKINNNERGLCLLGQSGPFGESGRLPPMEADGRSSKNQWKKVRIQESARINFGSNFYGHRY
jgi:hypothetical protein